MKRNPAPPPGTKKYYRISVYDLGDNGRWLESADFSKRPLADELTPDRLPKLNRTSGGRFEIRVGVMRAGEEYHFYGWTETRPAQEKAAPDEYPKRTADGCLVWACCESAIGQPCEHKKERSE